MGRREYRAGVDYFHVTTVLGLVVFFFGGYENYVEVESHQVLPLIPLTTLGVLGTALTQFLQNQLIQKSSAIFERAKEDYY